MRNEELLDQLRVRYADGIFSEEEIQEIAAEQELEDFLSSEIEVFRENSICSAEKLHKSIAETRRRFQIEAASDEREHGDLFYQVLDGLLKNFDLKIYGKVLPEPLNNWWSYSYVITNQGIKLLMNYYSWSHSFGDDFVCMKEDEIVLLQIPAKLLSVSEFAAMHGVAPVTVRQWIRRAKIRSAVKYGNEWRISEMTELPKEKGYTPCRYFWRNTLIGLPEKYSYLNEFSSAFFARNQDDKDQFYVSLGSRIPGDLDHVVDMMGVGESGGNLKKIKKVFENIPDSKLTEDGVLVLSSKEREELELYLIGNPLVECLFGADYFEEIGREYCSMLVCVQAGD